tara:strand:+ start:883 stop:1074 length:192 start_codon:yes stop_codon:yes gene_type:complete
MTIVLRDTDENGHAYEVMTFANVQHASEYRDTLVYALETETDRSTIWDMQDAIRQIEEQLNDI